MYLSFIVKKKIGGKTAIFFFAGHRRFAVGVKLYVPAAEDSAVYVIYNET